MTLFKFTKIYIIASLVTLSKQSEHPPSYNHPKVSKLFHSISMAESVKNKFWLVGDLEREYDIKKLRLTAILDPDVNATLKVLLMNDFNEVLNPPNVSKHHLCNLYRHVKDYIEPKELLCRDSNGLSYRYIAIVGPKKHAIFVLNFEAYDSLDGGGNFKVQGDFERDSSSGKWRIDENHHFSAPNANFQTIMDYNKTTPYASNVIQNVSISIVSVIFICLVIVSVFLLCTRKRKGNFGFRAKKLSTKEYTLLV